MAGHTETENTTFRYSRKKKESKTLVAKSITQYSTNSSNNHHLRYTNEDKNQAIEDCLEYLSHKANNLLTTTVNTIMLYFTFRIVTDGNYFNSEAR